MSDAANQDWLDRYLGVSTGTVGHLTTTGFLDWEIAPLFRPLRFVGRAMPVSCQPTDNAPLGEAVAAATPGMVLVVARQGDRRHAPFGGLMARMAAAKGVVGVVIDGAATDLREIVELQLPVFARNLSALTTRRQNLPGTVGEPVVCGGVLVRHGDIVLGDDDGVVVVPAEEAEPLLRRAYRFEEWEHVMRAGLVAGLSPAEARARADAEVDRSLY
ncbi:MAG: RraA family protein [Trueperaceae bacterium]|nr:RraA family protein [Trueperaceae bacterium]